PIGVICGYVGGFVDALFGRITDAVLACPFLILAIALAAFLGPSLANAMIAIGIYDDANIHTADARPGDGREGRGLCRGRARRGIAPAAVELAKEALPTLTRSTPTLPSAHPPTPTTPL